MYVSLVQPLLEYAWKPPTSTEESPTFRKNAVKGCSMDGSRWTVLPENGQNYLQLKLAWPDLSTCQNYVYFMILYNNHHAAVVFSTPALPNSINNRSYLPESIHFV